MKDCEAAVQQGTCGERGVKRVVVGIDVEIELQNERECGLS